MKENMDINEFNRRDFIKGGSMATLMTLLGGVEITAQTEQKPEMANDDKPRVNCAVIGLGNWGREMVATLGRLPQANLIMVSENYEATLKRAAKAAPNAKAEKDYRKVLDNKDVQAVLIATPSHQHRDIVIAALQAGKHVYCEAPLATTIEDARAIAKAAKASPRQYFQAGLLYRSDPQRHFLLPFIRAGALGKTVMARAQWHKKQSWRGTSPNPTREQEMNWRLSHATSAGLMGEFGIHQIDSAGWFLGARPLSVTGFGSTLFWKDGREVPDTVQLVFEFPGGVNFVYDATLANSFDSEYEMYYGSDAAVMLRESKAWMFKEVDAPLLGWEVYANKDSFYKETGIALSANATKLSKQGTKPGESDSPTPLFSALDAFVTNTNEIGAAVEDFKASYDVNDVKALKEYLGNIKKQPGAGYQEGLDATIIAIKANEAVLKGGKVSLSKDLFEAV